MGKYTFNRPRLIRRWNHPATPYRIAILAICVGAALVVGMLGETVRAVCDGTLASGMVVEHTVREPHEGVPGERWGGRFCLIIEHPRDGTVTSRTPLCGRTQRFLRTHPIGTVMEGRSEGGRFSPLGPKDKWQRGILGVVVLFVGLFMFAKHKRRRFPH